MLVLVVPKRRWGWLQGFAAPLFWAGALCWVGFRV